MRYHILGRPVAALLVAAALLGVRAIPAGVSAQSAACAVTADAAIDAEEQAALEAINALRAGSNLPALTMTLTLTNAAAWKSASMAATGALNHDDPGRSWSQRFTDCGYRGGSNIGETLAAGPETGRGAVQMWRDSAPHHRIMMNPEMRAVGIARVRGGSGWFWTATFGTATDGGSTTGAPAPTQTPAAATAAPLRAGGAARVQTGDGDCLNVRSAPSRTAPVRACIAEGTVVKLIAGPRESDGLTWWQLDGGGWATGQYLAGMQ